MRLLVIQILLVLTLSLKGKKESDYIKELGEKLNAQIEVKVANGRVDLVTKTHAIEVERGANWKNAIGQALWYSFQTGKKAGIILIEDDGSAMIRLKSLIRENKLDIKVWMYENL